MFDEYLIKTWLLDDKKVELYAVNNKLEARIFSLSGELGHIVSSCDINIPKEIVNNFLALIVYVQDTYIYCAKRSDGSVGLYVNPRLRGGGWFDGLFSVVLVVAGVALIGCSGGTAAVVSAGLINAGVNGIFVAIKSKENFSNEYCFQTVAGAFSGAITGGAAQIASGISSTSTVVVKVVEYFPKISSSALVVTSKIAIQAAGGAVAQVASQLITEGKVDAGKVCAGALVGGIQGAIGHFVDGVATLKTQEEAAKKLETVVGIDAKEASEKILQVAKIKLAEEAKTELLDKGPKAVAEFVAKQEVLKSFENQLGKNVELALPAAITAHKEMSSRKERAQAQTQIHQAKQQAHNSAQIAQGRLQEVQAVQHRVTNLEQQVRQETAEAVQRDVVIDALRRKLDDRNRNESVQRTVSSIPELFYQVVPGDGHCLFVAVGFYLGKNKDFIRQIVSAKLEDNREEFRGFIQLAEGQKLEDYLEAVRTGAEWASHVEIEVLMRLLNRPILAIGPTGHLINPADAERFEGDPIFVAYNGHNHYDSYLLKQGVSGREVLSKLLTRDPVAQQAAAIPQPAVPVPEPDDKDDEMPARLQM